MKFYVTRQHIGDKLYMPGDTREANESDVKHLIGKTLSKDPPKEADDAEKKPGGATKPAGRAPRSTASKATPVPAKKAEPAPANKAEDASPQNKSE
ncbi:hypothetical protein CN162_01440 [Sinorhizobium meliloti]|uniref:hypothetical protein n=1 Tax=Rhizobium meliloti TaxID=382 RepID=UPI000FD72CFF|nr:hypothetical protein [Sinorhizobium meliloti]RVK61935.1 hypothetical protein CN162_01440 [Sinorhizobium meliloti]